jgi:hypothetical protein
MGNGLKAAAYCVAAATWLMAGGSPARSDKLDQTADRNSAPAAAATPRPERPAFRASDYFPIAPDPVGRGCDATGISESKDEWYSRHLRAAGEPSLFEAPPSPRPAGAATYRFTWLRTFHHPVVIRVEVERDGRARLIATELSGYGGYDPGKIARRMERKLSSDEARRLGSALAATRLLTWPARDCHGLLGIDGSQWIVEARDRAGYHLVDRWSPESGPMREVGQLMLGLTGWQYGEVY